MAVDTKAKRASIIALGGAFFLSPSVVPDGTISQFDRQVAGYGYGGITAGQVATAGFVCLENITLTIPSASVSLTAPEATVTLEC